MSNPNFNNIITTTIDSRTRALADNITNNSALLRRLRRRGGARPVSGGRQIVQEIDFAATTNVGWYSGLGTLTTSAFEHATAAEYPIREAYASMIVSGLEQAQNLLRMIKWHFFRKRRDRSVRLMISGLN